ncbi:hypothetical protein [Parendozoicomonas haliclonae]|uniref:Uncharacterized protein n=1 Tax=Parendozoicomonas haliclonae TaxID=1960125 RepID=A0A1X7AHR2_9GAMM|nr:hypothetical protein [Parendozoicomonas haliclonae]SMA43466.1 hypothetical protein EHSB41UT_01595 [Parendozoicomonas haliclonae]
MPGIQNPKIDSGRLLLSASIAAVATQVTADPATHMYAMGGALAGSNSYAFSPATHDTIKQHPEWHWLPGYKWNSLSKNPYSFADRTWEALSGEIGPVVSVFALHYLSKRLGTHYQLLTAENGDDVADYVWRLGEAVGDYASSDSTSELLWRLFASNVDKLNVSDYLDQSDSSRMGKNVFWLFKRALAYAPMMKNAIPETLRQHVLHSVGFAGIAFDTPVLNEHFALTFISSSSADDPGRPKNAYLDLDFVRNKTPFADPEGRFENALAELEKASAENNVTRVRFYPAILGDQRRGGKLALFVRFYVNDQPSSLIRFPAEFGSSHDRTWWTDAVDRGILQGVYNSDQYTVVKMLNELASYKKNLITPISDRVLEKLPALMKWAAERPPANDHGFKFEQQMHTALEPDIITVDGGINLGLPDKPKQSVHHTAINAGDNGFLFIDDYFSQRVELPIMTMVTRSRYGDIKPDDLLKLEKHLPWQNYRGSNKLAMTFMKNQAYTWLVSNLMKARSEELKEHREKTKKYSALLGTSDAMVIDMLHRFEEQLVEEGKDLQTAYDEQLDAVKTKNKSTQKQYNKLKNEYGKLKTEHAKSVKNQDLADKALEAAKKTEKDGEGRIEEQVKALPKKGKEKFEELKTRLAAVADAQEANDKKALREARANLKDLVADKKLKLQPVQQALEGQNKLKQATTAAQEKIEENKEDIKKHQLDMDAKKSEMMAVAKDNKEIAKLAELEILLNISRAAERDNVDAEDLQNNIEESKKLGNILKLSTGNSVVDVVKESVGTLMKAIPNPLPKSKAKSSASEDQDDDKNKGKKAKKKAEDKPEGSKRPVRSKGKKVADPVESSETQESTASEPQESSAQESSQESSEATPPPKGGKKPAAKATPKGGKKPAPKAAPKGGKKTAAKATPAGKKPAAKAAPPKGGKNPAPKATPEGGKKLPARAARGKKAVTPEESSAEESSAKESAVKE